ncbi:MAG: amidohydrolase family protein [Bacteroidota bacterium]
MTIDAHQHFWNYQPQRHHWITEEMSVIRKDFLPSDLAPILKKNGIEGCIAVQVDQSEKETDFLIKCAQNNPFIKGLVGWTDFQSPGVQARLEYYYQFQEVKGFRHIVQSEPDDFLLNKNFCNGIAYLEQYNYTYDILIYPQQLEGSIKNL